MMSNPITTQPLRSSQENPGDPPGTRRVKKTFCQRCCNPCYECFNECLELIVECINGCCDFCTDCCENDANYPRTRTRTYYTEEFDDNNTWLACDDVGEPAISTNDGDSWFPTLSHQEGQYDSRGHHDSGGDIGGGDCGGGESGGGDCGGSDSGGGDSGGGDSGGGDCGGGDCGGDD